jgi:hypothetical protein
MTTTKEARGDAAGLVHRVPSMTIDLEVKVLWGVGRSNPSEPQCDNREGVVERSGERDLWGDEQKPDMRRGESGQAGV